MAAKWTPVIQGRGSSFAQFGLDRALLDCLSELGLAAAPADRQALFSATISSGIARIAAHHLRDPVRLGQLVHRQPPAGSPRARVGPTR